MPKLERASFKYVVSFNCYYGGYEIGETRMRSEDYHGDDIEQLAKEVISDDPDSPMVFHLQEEGSRVVGLFENVDDPEYKYITAIMVETAYFGH